MNFRIITIILLACVALSQPLMSQIEFTEVVTREDMEAARQKASDGMLFLFVDVYATWCGPCKMMDRQVYTDPSVAEYMNANFVNVRMDGETDYGRKYAAELELQGYPSMFIFSDAGEYISNMVGFRPAPVFLPDLKKVVDGFTAVKKYRKQYADGTLDRESYAAYVTTLRELGKTEEAEKLAGEYIRSRMGETLSDHDILVVAHYTDLEDPWWPQFTAGSERVKRVLGGDYLNALEAIYHNTLMKSVEQRNVVLASRLANELSPLIGAEQGSSRDLRTLPFLQYYYYTGQVDELTSYVDQRFAADRSGDHRWLFGAASQIIDMDQQYQTPEILAKAKEWLMVCIEMEEQYDYYFYYGMVMFFQRRREEAATAFEKAAALATTDEQRKMAAQVLQYVNNR